MTQLELKTTTGRCAETAQSRTPWPPFPAPWAYLARAGVRMSLAGQSAEDGVRDFEVQILAPGLDASNEQNWTSLASVDAPPPTATGRPVPVQTTVASVQIGRTRAQDGLRGDGSDLIPSPSSLALYEGLDVTTSRLWTLRARCRSASSNLWSSWLTYPVNVGHRWTIYSEAEAARTMLWDAGMEVDLFTAADFAPKPGAHRSIDPAVSD